jgi:hypothetical protein
LAEDATDVALAVKDVVVLVLPLAGDAGDVGTAEERGHLILERRATPEQNSNQRVKNVPLFLQVPASFRTQLHSSEKTATRLTR